MRLSGLALRMAAAAACLLTACGCRADRAVDSVMADVNPFGWLDRCELRFENADTASLFDVSLVVRCGSDTDCDRLSLMLEFEAPDSTLFVERRDFPLHVPRKPASASALVTIPYRRGVHLSQTGVYTVTIKPSTVVRGVEAVGFTFEKN